MGKDAFYFPHDSNAKDDIKCVLLIEDLGLSGYGAFWVLIELLREQPNYTYPTRLLPAVARRYNCDIEVLNKVVNNYDLFVVTDDTIFYSESLKRRMELYDQKKEQARKAGKASGEKRRQRVDSSTGDEQTFNGRSTDNEPKRVNNSKVDNSKINNNKGEEIDNSEEKTAKRFTPPTLEDVEIYLKEIDCAYIQANSFINYYQSNGWKVGKSNMKDWKAAVRSWRDRDKANHTANETSTTQKLGYDERIENGRRTYGTGRITVPDTAPPRPGDKYAWNETSQNWILL